jgi:hypothetical protein
LANIFVLAVEFYTHWPIPASASSVLIAQARPIGTNTERIVIIAPAYYRGEMLICTTDVQILREATN